MSALPEGWEEAVTEGGRPFFINHTTQATQWERPRGGLPVSTRSSAQNSVWNCTQCTLENPVGASECSLCGAANPTSTPTSNKNIIESDAAFARRLQEEEEEAGTTEEDTASSYIAPPSFLSQVFSKATNNTQEEEAETFKATAPFELSPFNVPDESRTTCFKCLKDFTWRQRRHHCKSCGCLVCDDCSAQQTVVTLPGESEKNHSKERRVCDWCFSQLEAGHAHCLLRYVIIAGEGARDRVQDRTLAIQGMADVVENIPQMLASDASSEAQAETRRGGDPPSGRSCANVRFLRTWGRLLNPVPSMSLSCGSSCFHVVHVPRHALPFECVECSGRVGGRGSLGCHGADPHQKHAGHQCPHQRGSHHLLSG